MKDSDGAARYRALLDLVVETSLVLGSDLELPTLLAKLVALAERTLGAELSSVMLLDVRRQELHWEIADGGLATGVLRQMTVAVGEGIAGTVAATGEPIVVTDAEHDPRVARRVARQSGQRSGTFVNPLRSWVSCSPAVKTYGAPHSAQVGVRSA